MLDGMKPPLTTSGVGPIKRLDGEEHIRTLCSPRNTAAVPGQSRPRRVATTSLRNNRSIRAPALHG